MAQNSQQQRCGDVKWQTTEVFWGSPLCLSVKQHSLLWRCKWQHMECCLASVNIDDTMNQSCTIPQSVFRHLVHTLLVAADLTGCDVCACLGAIKGCMSGRTKKCCYQRHGCSAR